MTHENRRRLGCAAAIVGVGALVLIPFVLRRFGVRPPPLVGVALLIVIGVVVVGGLARSGRK